MKTTSPRPFVAAALVATALAAAPVTAAQVKACGPNGTVEKVGNGWLMSHPTFPDGPQEVTAVASPPFDPNLIYATNGVVLMRSLDAGCGWNKAYAVSSSTLQANAITALTVPSSANSSTFVYLGITGGLAGVDRPRIVTSTDRGENWTEDATGLPEIGRVREIAVNPQVQMVGFAVIETRVGDVLKNASLYATVDGGKTWSERTTASESFTPHGLIVDPVYSGGLFALDGTAVVRSIDNARSFEPVSDPGAPIDQLTSATGGGKLRLAAARGDGVGFARSDDNGRTWRTVPTAIPPRSIAMAPLQDVVAVSSGAEAYLVAGTRGVPITPDEGGAPLQLSITSPTPLGFAVTGVTSGAVVRATFQVGTTTVIDPPLGRPLLLLPTRPVDQFPSLLVPSRLTVKMAAGETRKVPYQLLLPRTPTPVDVMFLLDSTGSYQTVIDALREATADIVNALNTAGLDVRFGVANFEDYPRPYANGEPSNVPYNLGRRIGPSDEEFSDALASIVAHDGTTDGQQSSLTAIYQSVTGAGEVVHGNRLIDRGLDARFRPEALKLVMTSTDTEPHYRGQRIQDGYGNTLTYPGVTYGQVIRELRARGVRSVGIPVQEAAANKLRDLAEASHAVAPLGGVDCDGDGTYDLDTGDPLVCMVSDGSDPTEVNGGGYGLAAAVVGIVAGISDVKPVSLRVTKGADRARITSAAVRAVDLHADNDLDYDLQLTCPKAAAKTYDIALQASTAFRGLAGGELTLSCGGLPGTPPEPAPVEVHVAPRAVAAHGVSDTSPSVQTNPHTNPQPEPNPMPNVNAGMAFSQERQVQLALVNEQAMPTEDLAMSDHRRMQPDPGYGLGAGAVLAAATAVAVRRRRQNVCKTATASAFALGRPGRAG